ncbi:hypothetical protein OSB04_020501, partial [Centaurea solstitialis]
MGRRPAIGKLITPGFRPCSPEVGTMSPTTPFEFKVLSPRGMVHMNGVGLGIVAGLKIFRRKNRFRRVPPDRHGSNGWVGRRRGGGRVYDVTRRKADKSYTKVYRGGFVSDQESKIGRKVCIFNISPARFSGDGRGAESSGFLSCCMLCNKRLQGKDIFMYRGEKGFCSPECRSRQMVMDEKREKNCSSEAAESIKSPSNGCGNHQMFQVGFTRFSRKNRSTGNCRTTTSRTGGHDVVLMHVTPDNCNGYDEF